MALTLWCVFAPPRILAAYFLCDFRSLLGAVVQINFIGIASTLTFSQQADVAQSVEQLIRNQ